MITSTSNHLGQPLISFYGNPTHFSPISLHQPQEGPKDVLWSKRSRLPFTALAPTLPFPLQPRGPRALKEKKTRSDQNRKAKE